MNHVALYSIKDLKCYALRTVPTIVTAILGFPVGGASNTGVLLRGLKLAQTSGHLFFKSLRDQLDVKYYIENQFFMIASYFRTFWLEKLN